MSQNYQRAQQGPGNYGMRGSTRHTDYIVKEQSDRVDAARSFSGQEMAGISADVLKKFSKKLKTVKTRVDAVEREARAVKKEVDDMDAMVDSAIQSFDSLS